MEIEQLAVEQPEALAKHRRRPDRRHRPRPRPARSSTPANFPAERRREGRRRLREALRRLQRARTRRSSRSTRWSSTRRQHHRPRRQGHRSTRTPTSATPTTRRSRTRPRPTRSRRRPRRKDLNYVKLDGEVGIIGNGAGLVMSTLDVVAYAGENHGGVKPANFLDIGGGASAEVMANGLDVILGDPQVKCVFVNVFGGITACDEVANGIVGALAMLGDERDQAARRAPRRQQRRRGPPHPRRGQRTRSSPWPTPWTARPTRPPSSRTPRSEGTTDMSIFLNKDSKVIVQGITGGEGTKHTAPMLAAGTHVVGGVNAAQGRHHGRRRRRRRAAGLRHRRRGHGGDRRRRLDHLRPAGVHQGRRGRGHRRRDPARRRHHRGRPGAGHAPSSGPTPRPGRHDPHHRPELPRHHQPRRVARRHHPGRTSPARARSAWSRSRAR